MNNTQIKRRWILGLIALVLTFSPVTIATAQSNIVAALSVGSGKFTVGDVIPLTLSVTHPAGWRVIVPALDKQWGDFEVRAQATPIITAHADGTETTTQAISVVRMRPGETQTPPLELSIADDQGHVTPVDVAPVLITVQSLLVAGDTNLRDIKPQSDLITSQTPYWPLLAASVLGVMVLIGYSINRWRQRPVVDKRTPRQRILDTLSEIDAIQAQTPDEVKTACLHITTCLRDYLASTTDIPARDLTTHELAQRFKVSAIPVDWSARAIDVLRVCDAVKFANDALELTAVHGLVEAVQRLVEQYPPAPQPVPARRGRMSRRMAKAS